MLLGKYINWYLWRNFRRSNLCSEIVMIIVIDRPMARVLAIDRQVCSFVVGSLAV